MFILNTLIILAPFAWISGWWFGLKGTTQQPKSWQNWVSITSLGLVTVAGLLWFPAALFASRNGWASEHVRTVQAWSGIAVLICAAALVLSLFGKPRLILPIVVACLGAASFWIGTTIP
jgi:hypothetical protein